MRLNIGVFKPISTGEEGRREISVSFLSVCNCNKRFFHADSLFCEWLYRKIYLKKRELISFFRKLLKTNKKEQMSFENIENIKNVYR